MPNNERRVQLETWLSEGQRESDKLLVTVSSGLIAVSLPFLKQLDALSSKPHLIAAWVLLLSTISFVLISLILEKLDLSDRLQKINKKEWEGDRNWRNHLISVANVLAGLCFICALICLVIFLVTNIQ